MRQRILTAIKDLVNMATQTDKVWIAENYGVTIADINEAIRQSEVANFKHATRERKARKRRAKEAQS